MASSLALLIALGVSAYAHEFSVGSIEIVHPWSRVTPPAAPVASGYVKLTNSGTEADRLVEVIAAMAERAEFHRSTVEDGIAQMRPVETGVVIEPGQTVDFEAEKLHIMFISPKATLKDGEKFPATLVFEKAGRVDVEFAVQRKPAEASESHSGHGG
ncbi:MAG: copper chaperone PCu(A)C [Rhizobiaceae bacterium]|nr:copper chaperone PCu(A)C [Rhizobiaceae bacterium]